MKKYRDYKLTYEHLSSYGLAAFKNAEQLLRESRLLIDNSYFARAYFLSTASIEEVGKAFIAYEAKTRNLSDPGIVAKIKANFEDHSAKLTSAFIPWTNRSKNLKEAVIAAVDLMTALKFGREKSMYVDVNEVDDSVSEPNKQIREIAARDSVKVAENCFHHTKEYCEKNNFTCKSTYEDKLFCIRSSNHTKMMSTIDFWKYYIHELEKGETDHAKIAVSYHDSYFKKGKLFNESNG